MIRQRPYYTAKEMAAICGVAYDHFLRRPVREKLFARGAPRPYIDCPMKFDRATVDAWRSRHHPAMPKHTPANDHVALPAPEGDAWEPYLRQVYAER
jgi:hypothetical protein